jgi:RHS repeat-associated protein
MKSKFSRLTAFYSWSLFRTSMLCGLLMLPAHAANPDSPTDPGKINGENQETNDKEEEPASSEDTDCDGGGDSTDPDSDNSGNPCPPQKDSGNGGSGNDSERDCDDDEDDDDDGDVGCIKEAMPLAIAPNEPGLGVGKLNLYIKAADENLASLKFLEFYGLPQMSLTKTGGVGTSTNYDIIQAGSTQISFVAPNASGGVGNPVGASAYSLARLQHVDATGSVAAKETATLVKQYRSSLGSCCYPIGGGKAVSYETKAGRTYAFPLSGMEVLRVRADGFLVVNGEYGNGFIRQVKTVAGLMDVVSLTPRSYEIRKYAPGQIGPKVGNLWTANGSPILTLKIEAPAGTTTQLTVTRTEGSRRTVSNYSVAIAATAETWTKRTGCGAFSYEKSLKREVLPQGPDFYKVTRSGGVTGTPAGTAPIGGLLCYHRVSETFKNFPNKSTETFGTGKTAERVRGCSIPPNDPNGVGRSNSGKTSKGNTWEAKYDPTTARMNEKISSCVGPPNRPGGTTIPAKTQTYRYDTGFYPTPPPGDFRPRKTTTTTGTGPNVRVCGVQYFDAAKQNGALVETHERSTVPTAQPGDASNLKRVKTWNGPGPNQGRISQVLGENGTLTRFEYATLPNAGLQVTTFAALTADGTPVTGHSSRTIETRDARGWPIAKTYAAYTGSAWQSHRTDTFSRDLHGQITQHQTLDLLSNRSRTLLTQQWNGRQLTSRADEEGITTSYTYFPETNIVQQTRREAIPALGSYPAQPAITTVFSGSFTVNAAQVPVWKQKTTTTTAGTITQVETDTYDEKNRIISHTDTDALTTTTAYSGDNLTITETLPSGATRITAKDSQGRVLCVTGTAVVAKYYAYEILANGNERVTTYSGQDNGPRYQIEEKDSSGRIVRTASPASTGGLRENLATYGDAGHPQSLTQLTRTGQATALHEFNAVGSSIRDGLSADDALLQPTSATDRISTTVTTDELNSGTLWRVSRTSVLPTAGSALTQLVTTTRRKFAGFTGTEISSEESIDISGNTTTSKTTLTGSLRENRYTRPGVSDPLVSTTYARRLASQKRPGHASPYLYGYDALGRQISEKNPRHTQPATTTYSATGDQVTAITDAAGKVTTYTYHPQASAGAGQLKTLTLPDATAQFYLYTTRGELQASWGSQLNPTWNEYDTYGQLITLRTWQVAPVWTIATPPITPPIGAALTTWNYEPATGLLISKRDAANTGADYQYDLAGRLAKRTWARSFAGVRLATLYTSNPFGEITTLDYADTTPDVTMQRDRLGRLTTTTQTNQSQIAYSYNPTTLQLASETIRYDLDHNGIYEFSRTLDRSRDTLLRDSGFQLKTGTTVENSAAYSYSATDGRISQISNPQISNQIFNYSYTPNSNLLASVAGPIHTVTNSYEPDRDLLDVKQNKVGTSVISSYDYAVNAIGQRTGVATSGTAFPAVPSWAWNYDSLGQVIRADSNVNTRDRAYQYDAIGNRQKTANSLTLPSTANHTANALNQYTSLPSLASVPSYDLDGNATAYPLPISPNSNSTLTYDAENRLLSSTVGNLTTSYQYDARSRRIAKFTGITPNSAATLYLYDAWNSIAEYSKTAGTVPVFALAKTLLWGTDLSGEMQGAGGVGGLLAVNTGNVRHYPTYDGNGNVSEYLTSTGTTAAHFEYDPFGNTVVNTDTANLFTYRFSTKPRDTETGLYYYGYRCYDPNTGRWLNRDTIGDVGGSTWFEKENSDLEKKNGQILFIPSELVADPNIYSFIGNDSILGVDVLGLDKFVPDKNKHGGPHVDRYDKNGKNIGRYRPDGSGIPHKGKNPPKIPGSLKRLFEKALKKLGGIICIIPSEYLDSDGNGINDEMQQKLEEISGKSMAPVKA